jgi:hypothetical protein
MDDARSTVISAATGTSARRADAGSVRLGGRDVAGLLLAGCAGSWARWRRAGYTATDRLGPGPAWCWLTRSGLAVTGQHYAPGKPALARAGAHPGGSGHPAVPGGQRRLPAGQTRCTVLVLATLLQLG